MARPSSPPTCSGHGRWRTVRCACSGAALARRASSAVRHRRARGAPREAVCQPENLPARAMPDDFASARMARVGVGRRRARVLAHRTPWRASVGWRTRTGAASAPRGVVLTLVWSLLAALSLLSSTSPRRARLQRSDAGRAGAGAAGDGDVEMGDGGDTARAHTVDTWYCVETTVRATIRRLYHEIDQARAIAGDNGAGCFVPCGPEGGAGESQARERMARERLRAKAASARVARLRREEWEEMLPQRRLRRRLMSIH